MRVRQWGLKGKSGLGRSVSRGFDRTVNIDCNWHEKDRPEKSMITFPPKSYPAELVGDWLIQ